MILDFLRNCKTYDKNLYTKEYFKRTPCPKCTAIGRFKLWGSYQRHAIYFVDDQLYVERLDIKRVRCLSCKSTHAVMPGDLIPYKLLTFYVVIFVLVSCYLKKVPVLKIEEDTGLSYQLIYLCLNTFLMHKNHIHQYYRARAPADTPASTEPESAIALIKKPYIKFQIGYTESNRRPCFMSRFFYGKGAPPIGIHALRRAAT